LAARQLDYLREEWGIDFTERAFELLSHDPTPHRTRRILRIEENLFRMACGPWRLYYSVCGKRVDVQSVGKGYADELLDTYAEVQDREAQIAFARRWPKTEAV
jgi:hypothetical protein